MKRKLLGDDAQVKAVFAPGVPLTRVMLKLKSVPEPLSGVNPSLEKAEIRSVRIGPPPGRMFPDTFQLPDHGQKCFI